MVTSSGQNDDRLILLGAGPNNRNVGHGEAEYVFSSYFSRLEYNFDKKFVNLVLFLFSFSCDEIVKQNKSRIKQNIFFIILKSNFEQIKEK